MFKLATVIVPLFGAFDLVLVRRSPSVPPRTIETTGVVATERTSVRPIAKCAPSNVIPLRARRSA